jgi:hypothetical protein
MGALSFIIEETMLDEADDFDERRAARSAISAARERDIVMKVVV